MVGQLVGVSGRPVQDSVGTIDGLTSRNWQVTAGTNVLRIIPDLVVAIHKSLRQCHQPYSLGRKILCI